MLFALPFWQIPLFPLLVGDHSNPTLWKTLFPEETSVSLIDSTGTFFGSSGDATERSGTVLSG